MLSRLINSVLPVSRDDRKRALVAFALFGVFMASYYVFKSARDGLFLHYASARNLPYAYLGSAFIALGVMALYNRLLRRVDGRRLLVWTIVAASASGFAFFPAWMWVSEDPPQILVYVFFWWVTVYGALASTLFWTAANDSFDVKVGTRIYGFIGAGGILGAFLSGTGTTILIRHFNFLTEWVVPLGAGLVLLALPLVGMLFRLSPPTGRRAANKGASREGILEIFKNPYVAAIAGLVLLMTFAGTLFDLQYKEIVAAALTDKEDKTAFFATLGASISALGFVVQFAVTGPLLRRAGPIVGLMVLPLIGVGSAIVLLVSPTLEAIQVMWILAGGFVYSLNQSSKELLYIPTSEVVKYGSKGFIDVFVFRMGDGTASLVAIALTRFLGLALRSLVWVSLIALPLWAVVLFFIRRGYRAQIRALEEVSPTS